MNDQYLSAVFIAGTLMITVFAVVMTVFLVIHKQRRNRSNLERQQLEFAYNNALLSTKIEMQEQALQFVSQEIHDNVGQVLSFSCLQLSNLKSSIPEGETRTRLSDNLDIIRQSVKDLRLLSHSLNTGLIEKRDLEEAIETELGRIMAFSAIKCKLQAEGNAPDLNPETRLLIFRIVQEALHNVVRHAGASNVIITVHYLPHSLLLCVNDDGKGIDMARQRNGVSVGMTSMRQRAILLKGRLDIESDGKQGTSVTLKIPL